MKTVRFQEETTDEDGYETPDETVGEGLSGHLPSTSRDGAADDPRDRGHWVRPSNPMTKRRTTTSKMTATTGTTHATTSGRPMTTWGSLSLDLVRDRIGVMTEVTVRLQTAHGHKPAQLGDRTLQ